MPFRRHSSRAATPSVAALAARFAFALVLIGAGAAHAATYYVSLLGNDANPGSLASPWRTVAKANSRLLPGDQVLIADGTYTDVIQPAANGTSPTQRISYVGNILNPDRVKVGNIYIDKAYVSVKGVQSSGGIDLLYTSEAAKAIYDSVAYCIATGVAFEGAKYSMVARNVINGEVAFIMDHFQAGPPGFVACIADTLRGNKIDLGIIQNKGFELRGFTQQCVIDSNRINGFFLASKGGDLQGRYFYNSYNNIMRDNSWTFETDGALPGNQYTAFALRDSSHDNLFERDSMLCGVTSGFEIGGRLCNTGNSAWTGQSKNNRWNQCYYMTSGNTFNQDVLDGVILENSVFASSKSWGLYMLGGMKNTIIRNCTFYSNTGPCVKFEGDIRLGGNQIYSNVFYSSNVGACFSGRPVLFHGWSTGFTENNNLFFAKNFDAGVAPASQSIYWASSVCSPVGSGTPWAAATGNDVNSRYGDPLVVNNNWSTLDLHLRSGSAAIGVGAGGVDAGAYPFGGAVGDVTPPASVTTLAASPVYDKALVLTWIAPGDDGTLGTAAAYDLRWSTAPINATNFASATAVPTQPVPAPGGSPQSYVMLALTPGTTYYFALKARDEVNNWSTLSNVPSPTTAATDVTPPAAVRDLTAP